MGHIDDRQLMVFSEASHQVQQSCYLGFAESCRWFIQYENGRLLQQGSCDLDDLLLTNTQAVDKEIRIEIDTKRLQNFRGAGSLFAVADAPKTCLQLVPEKQIVTDRQLTNELEMLIDNRRSSLECRRRGEAAIDLLADGDLTSIWCNGAA